MRPGMVQFTAKLVEKFPKSTRIEHNGKLATLPKSQIEDAEEISGDRIVLTIPEWLYNNEFENE